MSVFNIGTNGKGRSYDFSLASGYAEFMERFQNRLVFDTNVIREINQVLQMIMNVFSLRRPKKKIYQLTIYTIHMKYISLVMIFFRIYFRKILKFFQMKWALRLKFAN